MHEDRNIGFGHLATGERTYDFGEFLSRRSELVAIQLQGKRAGYGADAFVAVQKRMVSWNCLFRNGSLRINAPCFERAEWSGIIWKAGKDATRRTNMLHRVPNLNAADGGLMRRIRADRKSSGAEEKAFSHARLDKLIEEATVDCDKESEQVSGFFCLLEEHLELPFTTSILAVDVVEGIELADGDEIEALCRRGRDRQRIPILDLPLPLPRPAGAEWIEACRRWARWR
jgi:hypothetical protein